jgi:hypothetical protein
MADVIVSKPISACPRCGSPRKRIRTTARPVYGKMVCGVCAGTRLKKHRENNKDRGVSSVQRAAHKAVATAVLHGILMRRPCEECGAEANVHAHHHDYARPLDVQWLCATHHKAEHRRARSL